MQNVLILRSGDVILPNLNGVELAQEMPLVKL